MSGVLYLQVRQYANEGNYGVQRGDMTVLPDQVIEHVPDQVIEHVPDQVIEHLPDQVIEPLPDQVIEPLPDQVIKPLPDQVTGSLPDEVPNTESGKSSERVPDQVIKGERSGYLIMCYLRNATTTEITSHRPDGSAAGKK